MGVFSGITLLCVCATFAQVPAGPAPVRVGIVAYEDFQREYGEFAQLLAHVAGRAPQLQFELAVGSYGEVLQWLDRQQIDLAVLTPGVFAGLLTQENGVWQPRLCEYVATLQLPAANSTWSSPQRRQSGRFDHYQSVCLVPAGSPLQTSDDLRRLAAEAQVEFLFVHPLSVSGHVAPLEALRQAGVPTEGASRRFTYSHSQSIRLLTDPSPDRSTRVAFVWDDASGSDPGLEEGVRQLPLPELEQLMIPHDVVVARRGFPLTASLRELMLTPPPTLSQPRYQFVYVEDWPSRYAAVRGWLAANDCLPSESDGERISLDEIGHQLLQYARSQPQPPRVALVLSGGGAKCSYQVGAVAAIEAKLSQLRQENPQHPLDIQLVVGTSGGAINSLPVAIGVSRSAAGRAALHDTWTELNQCEIIQPPLAVRINMGLWFALLQTALVVWLVRWWIKDEHRRGWAFGAVYTMLAGIEILMGYAAPPPWRLLGTNHVLHHMWLWLSFGVKASAWSLFAIGVGAIILQALRARRGDHIQLPRRFTKTALITGLVGLPLLQVFTILVWEETLSVGDGMERALATKFPPLINRHLEHDGQPPLNAPRNMLPAETLRHVSRQIVAQRLLQRDLVITGSCLDQTSQELPSDLYFFAPANGDTSLQPYGERGLSLLAHPDILLDVIMGSGSIYPLFPARSIQDIPHRGEQIELVDGGFAHNSPIEAAVLWGATHIILIDVAPRGRIERGNFLQNTASSIRHLHRQAQLLDARSRQQVTVFTLAPEPPHICLIDFADNLVSASITQGERDASGGPTGSLLRFQKEVGTPVLHPIEFPSRL